MNRKQRNQEKRYAHQDFWIDGISLYAIGAPINKARRQAKLRRLYHRRADWICPKNAKLGYKACDRCHWLRKCKAMRTNSHPRGF